ncbi:MAG: DMT family transporter [Bacteroidales bacterium]|nr:DMT family transporter [Bacteroidales bacterium]
MYINSRLKGYLFAFLAALALSNVYIFSKAALNELHLAQFGFYWFGLGLLWNLMYTLRAGKIRKIKLLNRRSKIALISIGILEVAATLLFFISINIIENPAIVAFIANMTPFFVTVLGILILHERFNMIEVLGLILTLGGTFVISYQSNSGFSDFLMYGSEYILISGLLYAVATIIAKANIKSIDPSILSLNRVVYLFGFSVLSLIFQQESLYISRSAFFNIFMGSLLGPFLTAVASYTALKYIEASKATLVRSTRNVFVLVGAYLFFDVFPDGYQLIGAAISIIGVILISLGKIKYT